MLWPIMAEPRISMEPAKVDILEGAFSFRKLERVGGGWRGSGSFMHEIGIAQNALDQAIDKARKSGATQIHVVQLRVGAMSGVVPEALTFAFEALRQGTMAANASLQVETVAAVFWCRRCQSEFAAEELQYECPKCHQFSSEMRRGRELELASMEVS